MMCYDPKQMSAQNWLPRVSIHEKCNRIRYQICSHGWIPHELTLILNGLVSNVCFRTTCTLHSISEQKWFPHLVAVNLGPIPCKDKFTSLVSHSNNILMTSQLYPMMLGCLRPSPLPLMSPLLGSIPANFQSTA